MASESKKHLYNFFKTCFIWSVKSSFKLKPLAIWSKTSVGIYGSKLNNYLLNSKKYLFILWL
jgi:hypothetical protein